MRRLIAIFLLAFLPTRIMADAYFVDLEAFRKWPQVAQQAYVLGVVDQGLQAAFHYEPALYAVVEKCMQNVTADAMLNAVLEYVLKYKYDEPVTDLVGDGLKDYCERKGYRWPQ